MKFTGEQLIPGLTKKRLVDEHENRYFFATKYAQDKKVLDIACGTGYGSSILSKVANSVVGVDISGDSIKFAKDNYSYKNLEFIKSSATDDIFDKQSFDLICSFETIEHLNKNDREVYLYNIHRWLKNDGILLLSTPNKKITSPFTKKPLNKYHIIEFTRKGLISEVNDYFSVIDFYGQRFIYSFLAYKIVRRIIRVLEIIVKINFKIYSSLTSCKVSRWSSLVFQPRIIILIIKKKYENNKEN